jgi:hypothetical protein
VAAARRLERRPQGEARVLPLCRWQRPPEGSVASRQRNVGEDENLRVGASLRVERATEVITDLGVRAQAAPTPRSRRAAAPAAGGSATGVAW